VKLIKHSNQGRPTWLPAWASADNAERAFVVLAWLGLALLAGAKLQTQAAGRYAEVGPAAVCLTVVLYFVFGGVRDLSYGRYGETANPAETAGFVVMSAATVAIGVGAVCLGEQLDAVLGLIGCLSAAVLLAFHGLTLVAYFRDRREALGTARLVVVRLN
jgi:hypothetical protein